MKFLSPAFLAASLVSMAASASAQIDPVQDKTTIQPSLALTFGVDQNAFVKIFAGNFTPDGLGATNGQIAPVIGNQTLFAFTGTSFGGNGLNTFGLPDLSGRVAVGSGNGPGLAPAVYSSARGTETVTLTSTQYPVSLGGLDQPFTNLQPSLNLNYMIAVQGIYPVQGGGGGLLPLLGQVSLSAGNFAPQGWAFADGSLLSINNNQALFSLLGTTFGGDGLTNFALPDLRGRVPIGAGNGPGLTPRLLGEVLGGDVTTLSDANIPAVLGGAGQPYSNMQPSLGLNFLIANQGFFPSRNGAPITSTDTPMLGELIMFGGNFAPGGWLFADGSLLSINQNQALFSLLGTQFGGDGRTTFALPDLRGRIVVGAGAPVIPNGLSSYFVGQTAGVEFLSLDATPPTNPPPITAVPEPATFAYVALAGFALIVRRLFGAKKSTG